MSSSSQHIYPHKSEVIIEKSIKYFVIFFISFFNTWAFSNTDCPPGQINVGSGMCFTPDRNISPTGTTLDGSGGNVNTSSSYYQEKTNRLKREIADLNSQISAKQTQLEDLRRTCNPGSKNGCDFQIINLQNQISQLRVTLQQKTAEKTQAEENYATTSEYERTAREAEEASQDATIAAKKKVEKQKKLLQVTALVNGGAAAYLFKKCYACSPSPCMNFCYMGYAAVAQAGKDMLIAGKLGGIADQLSGVNGIPGNVCQMFPNVCNPTPNVCQTNPSACGPPTDLCQIDPDACTHPPDICQANPNLCPGDPPTPPDDICQTNPNLCNIPDDICQTDPNVCNPPDDVCQTNPDVCAAPLDVCQTNPEICNQDCATNPSLPHCTNVHPCPDGSSGECVTITQTCPNGEGQCEYTMPTDKGSFAGQTPPLTIKPTNGGKAKTVSTDISDIDMNDPKIKKTLKELEKKQAPLHKKLAALEQDLDLPPSMGGDSSLEGSSVPGGNNFIGMGGKFKKGKKGTGEGEFAGNEINVNDDAGGGSGARKRKRPYKNLMSQFRGRKKLKRDIVGEKSITFGEDKIGVTEDNIFLMVNKTYEEHRKANEFIEDPIPVVKTQGSSL